MGEVIPWQPLVTEPAERDRLIRVIADIAAQTTSAETIDELSDLALLRTYAADLVPDDDDVSGGALTRMVTLLGETSGNLSLFGGIARVGWTVAHLADGDTADLVCAAIDRALLGQLADGWPHVYDLISGLVGFGVYALERGEAGGTLARRVLELLEQRARPQGAGLAWLTPPEHLPEWQREDAPHGYWNLGVAHGIPGIVAFAARCHAAGIEPERCARLIDGGVGYLLAAQPPAVPRYRAWLREGIDDQAPPTRLAWCYGELGVAVALYRAACVRGRADWASEAIELALARAAEPPAEVGVIDAGLCHGAAGAAHVYHRLYRATGDARLADAARRWLGHTLALRSDRPIAGFPAWNGLADAADAWAADASLLAGAPGVALALAAMVGELEPGWDRLLLVDL